MLYIVFFYEKLVQVLVGGGALLALIDYSDVNGMYKQTTFIPLWPSYRDLSHSHFELG